jgi:UDP-N-acetylmuramyl pentapeptide phosphotransferase/UDP-N-acetylglucosamine-1-phosphate transferase
LGIYELPYWLSVGFSVIGTAFVTNAFNLIDGVDGLAGAIAALCSFVLGVSLAFQGNISAAYFSFALFGAVLGFLVFNRSPAKIFMGDSGSLFIGFSVSMLAIIFINSFQAHPVFGEIIHSPQGALIVSLSVLYIPVFDSFRVFITRIANGKHPFHADRIHLHHFLLDVGFSHNRIVTTLLTSNLMIITVALLVQDFNPNIGLALVIGISLGLFAILYFKRKAKMEEINISMEELKQSGEVKNNVLVTTASKIHESNGAKVSINSPAVANH